MQKLAIITAFSGGIGAGITEAFLKESDWHILGLARSAGKFTELNKNCTHLFSDLLNQREIPNLITKVKSHIQTIKPAEICFVHNFGQTKHANILNTEEADWDNLFWANVKLPFLFTKALSPLMQNSQNASHLFIGSTLSEIAVPDSTAYISSKHAIAGLMKSVAIDLANMRIRANLICPGFTESEMADQVIKYTAESQNMTTEQLKQAFKEKSPLKRFLNPLEIGNLAVYLAKNPAINAETININGGFGLI
jgi:NAD(P)-dependent dehydrogenase (short-subunit alcohol dehydrogenase family)